jgi:hypothetical protein
MELPRRGAPALQSIRWIDCCGFAATGLTPHLTDGRSRAIKRAMKTVICINCGKIIR